MCAYALGVDLGGTRIKAVAASFEGEILDQIIHRTRDNIDGWVERVRDTILDFEAKQGEPARVIGVGAPGIAAPDGRCIDWMIGRLELLQGLDFSQLLYPEETTSVQSNPCVPRVPVINDAQAALMGEIWQGAAKGLRNVALLTLGTGVGGAVMVDGRLLHGHLGRAGHLGHISLNPDGEQDIANTPGALEYMIGNYSIQQRSEGRFASTYELLEAYNEGDHLAVNIWEQSIKALAAGIVSIINIVDPQVMILGGGITQAGNSLLKPLNRYLDHFEWRPHGKQVEIRIASAGEFAGALGACYHALCQHGIF